MFGYNREIKHSILRTAKKFYAHTLAQKKNKWKKYPYTALHCTTHICAMFLVCWFSICFWTRSFCNLHCVLDFAKFLFLLCLAHSGNLNNLQLRLCFFFFFFFCDFLSHLQYICTNLYTVYIIILKISYFCSLNIAYKWECRKKKRVEKIQCSDQSIRFYDILLLVHVLVSGCWFTNFLFLFYTFARSRPVRSIRPSGQQSIHTIHWTQTYS